MLRAWLARSTTLGPQALPIAIVAINDLHDLQSAAHLLKYDSTHGPLAAEVEVVGDCLKLDRHSICWLQQSNPEQLPWASLGVDMVMECSGQFTSAQRADAHLRAGASRVFISAPAAGVEQTVVMGVNHQQLTGDEKILSNASCTTNGLGLIAQLMLQHLGIEQGMVNTIHCYTNDQSLQDRFHADLRRARAVGHSIIPTTTGVVEAVGKVLPALVGKLEGFSVRVPTQNVSLLDFTFTASRATDVEEINGLFQQAAASDYAGLLATSNEPLVSVDFNHTVASAVVDLTLTRVSGGNLVKVCAWYDNEWGFANRMLDVAHLYTGKGARINGSESE